MMREKSLREHLYNLESHLFEPAVRHNRSELSRLLADDFVEFGSGGEKFDKQAIIDTLAREGSIQISMSGFEIRLLSPEVALVTYRASIVRDNQPARDSLRCSIWKSIKGEWKMVFHQGTAI